MAPFNFCFIVNTANHSRSHIKVSKCLLTVTLSIVIFLVSFHGFLNIVLFYKCYCSIYPMRRAGMLFILLTRLCYAIVLWIIFSFTYFWFSNDGNLAQSFQQRSDCGEKPDTLVIVPRLPLLPRFAILESSLIRSECPQFFTQNS